MMNAPREILTISDIAKKALEQVADREQATSMALKSIYGDKAVFAAMADHLIGAAVRDEINKECGRQRSAAWNADMAQRAEELAAIAKNDAEMAAKGFRMILMEYRLSKGLLGDYTADMLADESAMYKRNARTLTTRAYWLDMIGAALPPKSKVRDALDEQALLALQQKAGAQ